jgi:hypothetical protein
MLPPLAINWPLSTSTGYGIYGLQLCLQFIRRGGQQIILTDHPLLPIVLPSPVERQWDSFSKEASQAADFLDKNPKEILRLSHPVLHGVGNSFAVFKNHYRVKGRPNVGCAAIEELSCPP